MNIYLSIYIESMSPECELLNSGDFNHVLMCLNLKPIKQITILLFVIYAVEPLIKLLANRITE